MATYYTLLTNYGTQQFAAAVANNRPLTVTHFAVGDGNGKTITPNATRTTLFKEVYRAAASRISLDPKNDKQIIFELTIPENVGGFTIREMGLFDGSGKMLAHANCPANYKPQLSEGTGKLQVLRMVLKISHKDAVTLTIDNSTIWATVGQATPKTITATSKNQLASDGHTHEIAKASTTVAGIVQLNNTLTSTSTTQALTAAQGKALNDRITTVQTTANGKWTAVDATTARKGIVQLNNTLTSTSTTQALTAAQGKALNENKVGISNNEVITGEKTFHYNVKIRSNGDNSKIGRWGQNADDMFFQNAYSGKYLQIKNDGSLKYDNKLIFVKGFQNPSWSDVENKPAINYQEQNYVVTHIKNGLDGNNNKGGLIVRRDDAKGGFTSHIESLSNGTWRFWTQGKFSIDTPAKSGTLATTDDVATRLPLTGGTLTGNLAINSGNDYSTLSQRNTANKHTRAEVLPDSNGNFYKISYWDTNNAVTDEAFFPKSGRQKIVAYQDWVNSRLAWGNISGKPNLALKTDIAGAFTQSLNQNGWTKLPNGLILQWGEGSGQNFEGTITFPTKFPNKCFNVQATDRSYSDFVASVLMVRDITQSNFKINALKRYSTYVSQFEAADIGSFQWIAIGY